MCGTLASPSRSCIEVTEIAGGLVFTMMNNSLPLFLLAYTMPLGLPLFLNPGGPIPATIVALLTNERSLLAA